MAISKELTQKLQKADSDDEDEEEEDEILLKEDNVKTGSEIDDFIKSYRSYWDEKKKDEKKVKISNEVILEKEKVTLCSNKMHCKALNVKKSNDTLQENASDAKGENASDAKGESVNDVESENPCDISGATSAWHVEECNDETESKLCNKKYRSQNIDEMFDSMEEKLKHKVDLKLQKVKKKLKIKSNVKKHEEEEKEDEDDLRNLEFKDSKQKPILDCPLEETTSKENMQDKDLTSLKTIANTEQEPTSSNHEVEIDPKKYLTIKPKYFKTQMPDVATGEEENSDQEEKMHKIMSEAFADDDVVEEFRKEQEEEVCNIRI